MQQEFWYDALRGDANIFWVNSDLSDLWEVLGRAFADGEGEKARAVAAAGRLVADSYLSEHGLACYLITYLVQYYLPAYARLGDSLLRRLVRYY